MRLRHVFRIEKQTHVRSVRWEFLLFVVAYRVTHGECVDLRKRFLSGSQPHEDYAIDAHSNNLVSHFFYDEPRQMSMADLKKDDKAPQDNEL